jgi:hypothetical protein
MTRSASGRLVSMEQGQDVHGEPDVEVLHGGERDDEERGRRDAPAATAPSVGSGQTEDQDEGDRDGQGGDEPTGEHQRRLAGTLPGQWKRIPTPIASRSRSPRRTRASGSAITTGTCRPNDADEQPCAIP